MLRIRNMEHFVLAHFSSQKTSTTIQLPFPYSQATTKENQESTLAFVSSKFCFYLLFQKAILLFKKIRDAYSLLQFKMFLVPAIAHIGRGRPHASHVLLSTYGTATHLQGREDTRTGHGDI